MPSDLSHISLAIDPRGSLHLDSSGEIGGGPGASPRWQRAVEKAFAGGVGGGLLALASQQLGAALPPSLSFGRKLGKLYFTALGRQAVDDADAPLPPLPPPLGQLAALLGELPPLLGSEYASEATLERAWAAMDAASREERAAGKATLQEYLQSKSPAWHAVGRVSFHLAEQKSSPLTPFAFIATYADGVGESGQARHLPLGKALSTFQDDKSILLRLLRPVHAASERNAFVRALAASGDIYHPLAWTPEEAYAFLKAIPDCEAAGLVVRLPGGGSAPRRVRVSAQVGGKEPAGFGLDAMLDFEVGLALEGEELTSAERAELLKGARGLRLLRGSWVEVDPERLREALASFERGRAGHGTSLSLAEALRMLSGADEGPAGEDWVDDGPSWSRVVAGPWLSELLTELKSPAGSRKCDPGRALKGELRHYQRDGVAWLQLLARLGLGGCLADDMGLGKTIQIISLLLLLKKQGDPGPHLLVLPASLLGNWQAELARFAPSLGLLVAHRSEASPAELAALDETSLARVDVVLTTYGTLTRLESLQDRAWGLVVLDEAQAIKNTRTRAARAVKQLKTRMRFALTGTPIENRIADLWSLFDFLCPGLLGSAAQFTKLTKRLAEGSGYGPLRSLLRPYILRRLKTDPSIAPELPSKTELTVHCGLSKAQAALYQESVAELARIVSEVDAMQRRGVVLAFLMRFKQICNHPSLFTGDEAYDPTSSGKFTRLAEIVETLAARQEKLLVFTQFRQMTGPLSAFLEGLFGRPGLVLHGGTPIKTRQARVKEFQEADGPPFFVLSLKAGGTGLNLTEACHVVHFDRWWNPAVENQATDRAFRIGQVKNVMVHAFACRGTVEEKIDKLICDKRALAGDLLDGGAEKAITELEADELLAMVSLDVNRALVN